MSADRSGRFPGAPNVSMEVFVHGPTPSLQAPITTWIGRSCILAASADRCEKVVPDSCLRCGPRLGRRPRTGMRLDRQITNRAFRGAVDPGYLLGKEKREGDEKERDTSAGRTARQVGDPPYAQVCSDLLQPRSAGREKSAEQSPSSWSLSIRNCQFSTRVPGRSMRTRRCRPRRFPRVALIRFSIHSFRLVRPSGSRNASRTDRLAQ